MATATRAKSGSEKWLDGINTAVTDDAWNAYDCEVKTAVGEFNRQLSGVAGYSPLDWQWIKAMLWIETGADNSEWKTKPMQIGVAGDPGLKALLSGEEGSTEILPPIWKKKLTFTSARTIPAHNIRARIGYLLMRMARFKPGSVLASDTMIYTVIAKKDDNLGTIAKTNGTTVDVLKNLNPTAPDNPPAGTVLKYQKTTIGSVICGWRTITSHHIAQRYNGGGDLHYAESLTTH
jgi:hypothetical protein